MIVADLHLHTTNSDGVLTLSSLPAAAERAGVSTVAVTDHDRLHPNLPTPIADVDGLTIIHGIELRVESPAGRLDLLGYGARRTDALESLVERLQADRIERGRAIIERCEDRLGVELPLEARAGIGRPHIARAIETASEYTYDEAFAELIGDDCPCYVARDVPSFEEGRRTLAAACGLVGLAHPLRYDDPSSALEQCRHLDGVERFYPYSREVDLRSVDRAIDRYDLVATGGSDAHDETLGLAGLDHDAYCRFHTSLTLG